MYQRLLRTSSSLVLILGLIVVVPAAAACAPGEGRGVSVNATTGEQISYCIPAEPAPGFDYNPQTNPLAPPPETVLSREEAAQQRANYEIAAAAAAAAERERIAIATPVIERLIDPTDPFPILANGEKIPGTIVNGQQDISCPIGSGRGVEVNATTGAITTSCIKNFITQAEKDASTLQEQRVNAAREEARKLSEEWNAANPGQQKCFSYSIGNESGGVCANPVKVQDDEPQETDGSFDLEAAISDPFPTILSGQQIPGTRVVGQQEIVCPIGSAGGIEVNVKTGVTTTSCLKNFVSAAIQTRQLEIQKETDAMKTDVLADIKSWNSSNPGSQKCFGYGQVLQVDGSTDLGSLCAVPVSGSKKVELIEVINKSDNVSASQSFTKSIPKVLVFGTENANVIRINQNTNNITAIASKKGESNINLRVTTNSLGLKEVTVPTKLAGYNVKVNNGSRVITSVKVGNVTYFSDGQRVTQLGSTFYNSNGTRTVKLGSTSYSSDGTTSVTLGSTTYRSTGVTSQKIGSTTYFSNGQIIQSLR